MFHKYYLISHCQSPAAEDLDDILYEDSDENDNEITKEMPRSDPC